EICDDGNMDAGDGCEACQIVGIPVGSACENALFAFRCVEGAFCDDRAGDGVCAAIVCGDGSVNGDEICDDGNDVAGDGCEACQVVAIPQGNPCEVGGVPCALGSFCDASGDAPVCAETICGDGNRQNDEECDDGNQEAGDGCDAECMVEVEADRNAEPDSREAPFALEFDANGHAEALYQNNPTSDADWFSFTLDAPRTVTIYTHAWNNDARCVGDTVLALFDAEDNRLGGNDDGGGRGLCSQFTLDLEPGEYLIGATAFSNRIAGPNFINVDALVIVPEGEACDPAIGFQRCAAGFQCLGGVCAEPVCGDGLVGPGEACDDGNDDDADGCTAECTIAPIAAGGACDPEALGFEAPCEDGTYCGAEGTCVAHECGDGVLAPDEACDDGNENDADGCTAECAIAPIAVGEACPVPGTDCAEGSYCSDDGACTAHECGDGIVGPEEQCDGDANCNENCELLAEPIDGPGNFEGAIPVGGNAAWAFELDAPTRVLAFTSDGAEGCPGDTVMELFDADTNESLATNDDGGPGQCSQIELNLDAGSYRIVVTEFGDDEAIDALTLTVLFTPVVGDNELCDRAGLENVCADGLICALIDGDGIGLCAAPPAPSQADEVEPNETPAAALATALIPDARVNANFGEAGADIDLFAVTLDAPGELTVFTAGPNGGACPGDTRMYQVDPAIVDADGMDAAITAANRLAFNDDGFGVCSRLVLQLEAGTYYFMVDEFGRNRAIDYSFNAILTPAPAPAGAVCDVEGEQVQCGDGLICFDDNLDNDGTCAAEMAAVEGANASEGFGDGGLDLWSFQIDSPQRVTLATAMDEAECGDNDTRVYLYRVTADGADELTSNDDADGLGLCSMLSEVLMPGRYQVVVNGFGNSAVAAYSLYLMGPELLPEGEACDRSRIENRCDEGLGCMPGDEAGIGVCAPMAMAMDEVEPDSTTADALLGAATGSADIAAALFVDVDATDVFALVLETPAVVTAFTGNGEGGCPGDTRLYRIDGDVLDDEGVDAAVAAANRLAFDDDGGAGACSRLSQTLEAGTHYFLVDEFGRNTDIPAYTLSFRVSPILPEGAMCDAAGVYNACGEGLDCVDDDQDNDGMCMAPPPPP
ncbi:MAG: DVUA0089 family protein, partial [Myxococcales bacterium]|nr:DVUA0089 family protein [Myxococcales bacterium]